MAPEVIKCTGHDTALDWWCTGVCLYEFLVGIPPFFDDTFEATYVNILTRELVWPEDMSPLARDLIDRLLTVDPNERLGAKGAAEVKAHPFFRDIDWENLATTSPAYYQPMSNYVLSGVPRQLPRRHEAANDVTTSLLFEPGDDGEELGRPSDGDAAGDGEVDVERFLPFHFKNLRLLEDMNKFLYDQTQRSLPAYPIMSGLDDDEAPRSPVQPVAVVRTRCLVAEDNPVTQVLVKALLKQMGIDIVQAYTGTEAVQFALTQQFDMIFMDIMMPGLEGTEATRLIRRDAQSLNKSTPVIAFTAISDWKDDDYTQHGMDDVLAKPVLKGELYNCIQKWHTRRHTGGA
eukprot:Unigene1802_Nuclearia_a/m.5642 Unigene1802_Nuclearia_a/g.5642  ORF Unigene1802_Nuclearia_a/g.5642 Unigene1802_Nuclearia_a/m.5642 type:complete len:346 (-) Unigene1802_Nuclearia_a:68-1105(-)